MATEKIVTTETRAAFDAGASSADLKKRTSEISGVPVALLEPGQQLVAMKDVLALQDARAAAPARRRGTATLTELDSFIEHVNRFKSKESVVFADVTNVKLQAVLDYHPAGAANDKAAWTNHRSLYSCPRSEQWLRWAEIDGKLYNQEAFAMLLEDHLEDLTGGTDADGKAYPQPIAMLEIARTLQLNIRGTYSRKVDQRTGAFELIAKQDTESVTTATIPRAFRLALAVFEGSTDLWHVEARVRCLVQDGVPKLGVALHRRIEIEREAFGAVRTKVVEKTGLPVLAGAPES